VAMPAIHATDRVGGGRYAQLARLGLMFDPWLTSTHPAVAATAASILAGYEHLSPPRRRSMKARDREALGRMLRAVVANFAYAIATGVRPPAIGMSLRASKRKLTRYDPRGFSGLPVMLEALSGPATFSLHKSDRKGTASALTAGQALAETLSRFRFRPEHFGQAAGRETICLARVERDFVDGTTTREPIDYSDTAETRSHRAEMEKINAALATAPLGMAPGGGPPVFTAYRPLRRHFNLPPDSPEGTERFDLGGRLFGGWWQDLPRTRRHAIRIAGQPVADLDFASMFLRLAYLRAGLMPPAGDLYAGVPGLSDARWRDGVKGVASAMLFRSSPLTRLPRDLKGELPPGLSGSRVRAAILTAHSGLAGVFETGCGLGLMFTESRVLLASLRRLRDEGVAALPMHDGLMVARSQAGLAELAMGDASEEVTGARLPISLKTLIE